MTYKKIIIVLALVLGFVAVLHPHAASALFDGSTSEACQGVGLGKTGCSDGTSSLTKLISTIINLISLAVGLASVIMIMVGGFKYVTSGGDSGKLTSAKNTIIYAIIGLVVVALGQFIVKFVLHAVSQ